MAISDEFARRGQPPVVESGRFGLRAGRRRILESVITGPLPLIVVGFLILTTVRTASVAVDFHTAYWGAGHRLLAGGSPYAWSQAQITGAAAFVYPALAAVLFVPFATIGVGLGGVIFTALCIACVPVTLWLLGVRDRRVYGVAMLWLPVFAAWQTANLTLLLVATIAFVWRYRDTPARAGVVTAIAISLKPFVWPLALWLICTRRWRAGGWALGAALTVNLISWAITGFDQIHRYLHLSAAVTAALWRTGYGIPAVLGRLGVAHSGGSAVEAVLTVTLIGVVLHAGLRERSSARALVAAVALMLVASPLLWSHYFALLLIPIAIRRPRLDAIWFAPILMWVCPARTGVLDWQGAVAWGVAAACLFSLYRDEA